MKSLQGAGLGLAISKKPCGMLENMDEKQKRNRL
jgi:hypothetical protein